MGMIVEQNAGQENLAAAAADAQIAMSGNTDFLKDAPEQLGFFGTAYETYMHETWVGNAMRYGLIPDDKIPGRYEFQDIDFNPFKYYLDNRDELGDMDVMVKQGLFDNVVTEAQFQDRVSRLRKELESKEMMANGSTLGLLAGGVLSFADVSTFIPGVNVAKKLQTAGKIGRMAYKAGQTRPVKYALAGAYYSAVQEAGLHAMQDLRTLDESVFNTAGGAVLGGIVGGAIVGASKSSPLHPSNPNYVLRPDSKVRMGISQVGQSLSESAVLQPVIKNGRKTYEVVSESGMAQSLSAAANTSLQKTEVLRGGIKKGAGVVGNAVRGVGKVGQSIVENTVGQASPIIRGLTSKSQVMMNITESLYDLGGILTKGHTAGEYRASLEDIANRVQSHFDTQILIRARESFVELQEKLAGINGGSSSKLVRGYQNIKEDIVGIKDQAMAGPEASGKPKPRNLEGQTGNLRHWEFEDVIRHAMQDDLNDELMDNLISRFGEQGADAIVNYAKKVGEDIHDLNKMIEDMMVEKGLITEDQRLGRDYIAPQMWDGKGILENKRGARRFFLEIFGSKPSDEFLNGYYMTEDVFNKLGKEDVSISYTTKELQADGTYKDVTETKVIKAGEEGDNAKLEILEEWSGDVYNSELGRLDIEVRNAEDEVVRTKRQAVLAARGLRKAFTDFKNGSVDEARKILKARQADREVAVAKREKLVAERKKLQIEEKKLAEEERIARETPVRDRQLRTKEVREGEEMLDLAVKDPDSTPQDVAFAQENLTLADINAESAARRRNVETNKSPELVRLRQRLAQITRDLSKLDRQLPRLEQKLEDLNRLVEGATAARKQLDDLLKLQKKARRGAKKDAAKAKRQLGTLKRRLDKKEQGEPLANYVEDLVDNLARNHGSSTMPIGTKIDSELFTSARTKKRMIKLTAEQRRRAEEMGLLRSDLFGTLHEGVAQTAKRIAFREVFGDRGTTDDAILKSLLKDVDDDWQAIIDKAKKDGRTDRHIRKLKARRARDLKDVENGVKRQLGLLHVPDNPEGMLHWFASKAREFNYVRYGSGFLIPSITDLSNVALTSGFGTTSYKNLKALNRTVKGMSNPEIRRLAIALEQLLHNSRNMKMNNPDDLRRMAGVGEYGSRKHQMTAATDRALSGLGTATTHMSGMMWWNTRLKMLAMIEMQHNFAKLAGEYDALLTAASAGGKGANKAELEIAKLASLGLGKEEMGRIIRMMQKHPPQDTDGVLEMGIGRWLDEGAEGQRAYQDVMSALEHSANRAIMTPGKGDTPFFMSSEWGKTLMQFQTYGFVIMNKYMMPAFQRMATYGDMEAFLSFGMALSLGTGVVFAKDILNNGEIKDRDAGQWAYDVIDRSGFLTYMSPLFASGLMYMGETPSRYSRERNRLGLVFGPTGGLMEDGLQLGDAALTGDFERAGDMAQKLTPFSLYQKIFKVIFSDED